MITNTQEGDYSFAKADLMDTNGYRNETPLNPPYERVSPFPTREGGRGVR